MNYDEGKEYYGISLDDSELRAAAARVKNAFSQIGNSAESEGSRIDNAFNKIAATAAGIFTIEKATEFAKSIIDVRGEVESLEISFETLVGNKKEAQELMSSIRQYAVETPMLLGDLAKGAQTLLSFNIEAQNIMPILKQIGDISMGDANKFNSLILAFSQMSSTGKLMGQDLLQMINAGFNPLTEISAKTGKSISDLKKDMEAGSISSKMVAEAFASATAEGGKFNGMLEKQSKGIKGSISNLEGAMEDAFNNIGSNNQDFITGGIALATQLVQNYETLGKVIAGLVATYGTYKAAVLVVNLVLKEQAAINAMVAASNGVFNSSLAAQWLWTERLQKAQAFLNKTMLSNPYVLAATLVAGLAVTLWALSDSTSSAEKAQKNFNDTMNGIKDNCDALKSKTDSLISTIRDESSTRYQANKAYLELQQIMPQTFKHLDIERIKTMNLVDVQKMRNEELGRTMRMGIAVKAVQAKQDYEIAKKAYFYSLKVNGAPSPVLRDDMIEKLDTWKLFQSSSDTSNKALKAAATTPLSSISKETTEATSKIRTLKKEIASLRSGKTKSTNYAEEIESKSKELKTWETRLSTLTGVTKSTESAAQKAAHTAENKRKQEVESENKISELKSKQSLEERRADEDIQNQIEQAHIDILKDGNEKTLAQMQFNHKKELQQLDRQKEDYINKIIDSERAKFNADPKNKGKLFNIDNVQIPQAQIDEYDSFRKATEAKQQKEYDDFYKTLTDKYKNYADQRLAIEEKFNKDIETLRQRRAEAIASGNKSRVDEMDKAIAQATVDKGKELMTFDFGRLKESPEYVRAFEDLKNTSSETLDSLLSQLQDAKQTAATVLSPDQLREYTTTIQSIIDELANRNPWQTIIDRKKELAEAEQELKKATLELRYIQNGGKIGNGETTYNKSTGKIDQKYITEEQAIKKVNAAKDKYNKTDNETKKAEKQLSDQVLELTDSFKKVGDAIGGTEGEIISFIGDIGSFVMTSMQSIDKVSTASANSIKAVEKASVILTIISMAIQLMEKLDSLLSNKAYEDYLKYDAKIEEINKITDAVNEYQLAVLKANQAELNWFSDDKLQSLKDYKDQQGKIFEQYQKKITEEQAVYQNKSGGGWLTSTAQLLTGQWFTDTVFGTNLTGHKYNKETAAAINNLKIETRKSSKGFLGSGIGGKSQKTEDLLAWIKSVPELSNLGDLFDANNQNMINKELADTILDKYGDKLVGQTKETLEALVKMREQYDEYIKQLREYVSSLYEPLVDDFVSSMWDWLDNGKDALDSFKDYASNTFRDIVSDMLKTMILDKVVDGFQNDIAGFYEKWSAGNLTYEDLMAQVTARTATLMNSYQAQLPTLQDMLKNISAGLNGIGIDITNTDSSSRSGTTKGVTTASQDSVDDLTGRATNIQGHTYTISECSKTLVEQNSKMLEAMQGIKTNTDRLAPIQSSIGSLKTTLDDISSRGVKIRN
ncbi:tape measure domain-containing protein [Bacteroides luti]|uniref:Tape measure domain-containing protein n=1 Tax=Bacteroides luti TaxID=1297750 RepID=A0A1M4XPL4_9BACE|nr:tape measure protein [Bacteroides luti]SHE95351.1 tape measure domain-containing protein [Bacteroides luti]